MKILCYINHFFGEHDKFVGKSSLPKGLDIQTYQERKKIRTEIVEKVIAQAKTLGDVVVKVCGIHDYSLVSIDEDFSYIRSTPLLLIYETISKMANYIDEYDYFINLEDDTFIPQETFENIVRFDKESLLNEILLPNRVEHSPEGKSYCPDILAMPGWTTQFKKFEGHSIKVALNPHSALVILSREKFKYALRHLDLTFRENILATELDSAFAYFHSPFALYRSENLNFHFVYHLDRWLYSPGEKQYNTQAAKKFSISFRDFVPPILVKFKHLILQRILEEKND